MFIIYKEPLMREVLEGFLGIVRFDTEKFIPLAADSVFLAEVTHRGKGEAGRG
ncbi:MAG: hypothetical protein ABIE47_12450 [Pseudomonadota bacterium]